MLDIGLPYIKAKFKGLFTKKNSHHNGNYVFSDLKWTYLEITECQTIENFDVFSHRTEDFWFSKKISNKRFGPFGNKTEIFIPISTDQVFAGNLYDVLIKNIKLNLDKDSFVNKNWYEATGDIYFRLEPPVKQKPAPVEVEKKVSGLNIIGQGNQQPNLVELSSNEKGGITILNPPVISDYSSTTNETVQNQGNIFGGIPPIDFTPPLIAPALPIAQSSGSWMKWLSRMFWLFILAFILFYLWKSNKSLFYILAGIGVLWMLSRVVNLGSVLRTIGSLLFFGMIGYLLFNLFYKSTRGSTPVKTRDGNIKIAPPKETDTNGDGKRDEITTEKDINWFDFSNKSYKAKYNTSIASFQNSTNQQNELEGKLIGANGSIDFFTKFYAGLYSMDQTKIKNIAKIFSDSATSKKLDAAQTADMVITFIQEIPYYLVHDESCQKAVESGNSFMVQYHEENKPCLPNISGGVQSPYEFLHNLKGDCDTRSLLGFSILKELNIASSVWVSEAYGHSILGVGVPVGYGIHKNINGVNHYGVELTAKGFRLGMVAPQNSNPDNWDITIYYNH